MAAGPTLIGARIGPYEILSPLGAGGMGEVYKARDTRLGRTVALKVLPPELAGDADRRARFEREARTLATLSHPHICVVHDVGREMPSGRDPIDFLVMECLEGETLAARLTRVKTVPIAEAIGLAVQIADALHAAHSAGIVHRDLKPANVMLTKSGVGSTSTLHATLLDFGLAKWRADAPIALFGSHATTVAGETAQGTILGTIHYMSPEQVEGREADARSDIWTLGVMLYEMVTGARPFEGESPASVIGAILRDSAPPMRGRDPLVPASLDRIVARCLEKDPAARWQDAADLRVTLGWATETTAVSAATLVAPARTVRLAQAVAAVVAGVLLVALGMVVGRRVFTSTPHPDRLVQFDIQPPIDVALSPAPVAGTPQIALSPDGRWIAFVGMRRRHASQIYVRSLDQRDARPLENTEGASFPFWSPDSRSLAFFAGGKLKRIDVSGGAAQVICDAPAGRGGTWNRDGVIVFSPTPNEGLRRVSAAGGEPAAVTTVVRNPISSAESSDEVIGHNWAQFLPDEKRFVFYQRSKNRAQQGIYAAALDSPPRGPSILQVDGLALAASGHLVWVRDGVLLAQPWDEEKLQLLKEPVRVADRVGYFSGSFGYSAIAASPAGLLAYGPPIGTVSSLQWYSRNGTPGERLGETGLYNSPRLSPDGRSVAVAKGGETMADRDIWTLDVRRKSPTRKTFDPAADWFPAWAPDSAQIFFGSTRRGVTAVFQKLRENPEEEVLSPPFATYAQDIASDGSTLLVQQSTPKGYDIGAAKLDGSQLKSFLSTNFNEVQPRFSPNGRWVAYASDDSGQFEVYVRSYPDGGGLTPVSSAGGMQPEWRRDGKELFYLAADGKMMAVPVSTDRPTFDAGIPQVLFEVETPEAIAPFPSHYTVSSDGQMFLVNTVVDQPIRPAITVIMNWTQLLTR